MWLSHGLSCSLQLRLIQRKRLQTVLDALLSETSHDISQQELRFIASRALGCAGAVIHES